MSLGRARSTCPWLGLPSLSGGFVPTLSNIRLGVDQKLRVVIFPSIDALDEFKLQTSTYSAEFGRSLGGVVNLQVKSGANQLRGAYTYAKANDGGVTLTKRASSNNRPDRIGDGPAAEPTVEQRFESLIKATRFGRVESELPIEAFNLLNHPQFAQPNGQLGNPGFGTITAMLSNPACATCGTTERQLQLGLKLRF